MTQYGFYFDNTRCTGCRTCTMACKDYNDLSLDYSYRKVYDYEGGSWTETDGTYTTDCFVYHVSLGCQHCDDPACISVCPTEAMHKDPDTGLVLVDETKCIGCGYCAMNCPYNVPKVNRELGHSIKCDGCVSRVAEGKNPICVDACPLRALDFGPIEELRQKYEGVAGIAPMPDPSMTNPNIVIKKSPAALDPGDTTGKVTNTQEVE